MKVENYKSACPKFRASYDVDPKSSTLLNLGTCYERNGQTASAWGAFSNAVVAARKAGKGEWAAQAEERVKALEPRLVRLTVEVPAEARTEGLKVARDTSTLSESEWGLAMAVDPGEHAIRASAPGHVAWATKTSVVEGAGVTLVRVPALVLEPKSAVAIPPTQEQGWVPFWTTSRVVGVTATGAGVVALGIGAVVGVLAKGRYDDSRALCPERSCANPTALSDNQTAFTMAAGSTILVVAGAVLAAGGLGLFLWAPDAHQSRSQEKKPITFYTVPSIGPQSAGLEAGGTF